MFKSQTINNRFGIMIQKLYLNSFQFSEDVNRKFVRQDH
jgi:hypothetical protein